MEANEPVVFKNEALHYKDPLMDQLLQVLDPELGLDIVNLGLIYEVSMDQEGRCDVLMTLTTIGCPLADVIQAEIMYALNELDFVDETYCTLTFDPPWTIDRMTRYGRIALGIRG